MPSGSNSNIRFAHILEAIPPAYESPMGEPRRLQNEPQDYVLFVDIYPQDDQGKGDLGKQPLLSQTFLGDAIATFFDTGRLDVELEEDVVIKSPCWTGRVALLLKPRMRLVDLVRDYNRTDYFEDGTWGSAYIQQGSSSLPLSSGAGGYLSWLHTQLLMPNQIDYMDTWVASMELHYRQRTYALVGDGSSPLTIFGFSLTFHTSDSTELAARLRSFPSLTFAHLVEAFPLLCDD